MKEPLKEFGVVRVFDESGTMIDGWVDDPKHDCGREYCGGCNRCIAMQYEHSGYKVEYINLPKIVDRIMDE